MKNKSKKSNAGWALLVDERHAHFFIGGTALCGDLENFHGPKDTDMQLTKDDCTRCRKMIETIMRLAKAA